MAKAKTFLDERTITVDIISDPTVYGLCKVKTEDGKELARHIDRLEAIDEEAVKILSKSKWSPYKQGK